MNKADLQKALDERGIAYDENDTNDALQAKLDDAGDGDANDGLPAESLEQGAGASTFVDNPDKPDESTIAQIEKLPDEK